MLLPFDFNCEFGEINLCFNTEQAFAKVLNNYQNGDFSENYCTIEAIYHLRCNTGDWEYQCFDTLYVFSEDELNNYFNQLYTNDVVSLCSSPNLIIFYIYSVCVW